MPLSVTAMRKPTRSASAYSTTALSTTLPCAVNFRALPTRFMQICRMRPSSPRTISGSAGSGSNASTTPLACAVAASNVTTADKVARGLKSVRSSSIRPASIFEKSSKSLMMVSSANTDERKKLTCSI